MAGAIARLLGLAEASRTAANLHRERECVLNPPPLATPHRLPAA